jgi:tryptophan 2,3-dioxygenase
VKLCKIHSLRANGKNVELIHRLRQHAQSLPKDSPLSVAARSEHDGPVPCKPMETDDSDQDMMEEDEVQSRTYMTRPSEQWEVVMDSIQEVEENSSQSTLSSQRTVSNTVSGEFGTGGSTGTFSSSDWTWFEFINAVLL